MDFEHFSKFSYSNPLPKEIFQEMTALPRGEKPIDHFENSHSTSEESQNHNTARQILSWKSYPKIILHFYALFILYLSKNQFNPFLKNNSFFNKQENESSHQINL